MRKSEISLKQNNFWIR